jgi:hypothetical protein
MVEPDAEGVPRLLDVELGAQQVSGEVLPLPPGVGREMRLEAVPDVGAEAEARLQLGVAEVLDGQGDVGTDLEREGRLGPGQAGDEQEGGNDE